MSSKHDMAPKEEWSWYGTMKPREQTIYYDDGKTESKRWWRNGRPQEHVFYKNRKYVGECKWWYENGNLSSWSYYRNEELDVCRKWWRETGELWGRESYHNGKLEGEHKLWWRNGRMRTKIVYRNGVRNGECKWWNADGELARHKFYRNGKTVDTHFTSKKWRILRMKRRLRNRDTHWLENMLIYDLVKIV